MSPRPDIEDALRVALRQEEASLKSRLANVLDKAPASSHKVAAAIPRVAFEVLEKVEVPLGASDLQRLKRLRKRMPKTRGKPAKSLLWRAGLLALESMSDDELAALISSLSRLQDMPAKPPKAKAAKKNKTAPRRSAR